MWTMLKKLGAGEYSLKITFWLFGLVGMFVFAIATQITHSGVIKAICPYGRVCVRSIAFFILSNLPVLMTKNLSIFIPHLLVSACFVCYFIILVRGLWKASEQYDGKAFWGGCAKIIILGLGVLSLKAII